MFYSFPFPQIDPEILHIYGPLSLRWYNLAYIVGIFLGLYYARWLVKKNKLRSLTHERLDSLVLFSILGMLIGGRLGYVFFYQFSDFMTQPWSIFKTWEGGMSFHGAILGMTLSFFLFSRKYSVNFLSVGDIATAVGPIGLFLGRIANFINDELYGRVTSVPWAVEFPAGHYLPRHPSQIYEAFLEGPLLFFILLWFIQKKKALHTPGYVGSIFLIGYGVFRSIAEFYREPDGVITLGHLPITYGQLLSLPMIIVGALLFMYVRPSYKKMF